MYKLTVAIPYCQEEKSILFASLQSALDQTFLDMEILIVDDSFSYKAQKNCQKYIKEFKKINKQNPKIKHINYVSHSQNLGCLATRITSIQHAKGEYITFLDTDDWFYSNESLQKMYDEGAGYDVLQTATELGHEDKGFLEYASPKMISVTTPDIIDIPKSDKVLFDVFYGKEKHVSGFVWAKLYRTEALLSMIAQIPVMRCTYFEDMLFTYFVACNLKTYKSIPDKCYFYNLNNGASGVKLITSLDVWRTKVSSREVFTTILYDMETRDCITDNFQEILKKDYAQNIQGLAFTLLNCVDKSIYPQALEMFYEYFGKENAQAAIKAVKERFNL